MREPSRQGSDWFRIENKKTDNGTDVSEVYIYDEIGFWGTTASDFVQQLAAVNADQIDLHLNSPGGEIFDGVAIYHALKGHPATVNVYVDGLAASAASFIAQAGDNVYMLRNSTMMIHDGLALIYGNAEDMHKTAELLDKLSNNIADIYSQRAGETVDHWRALMKAEVWYNADEAVAAGLADSVAEVESDVKAENFSLLKVFNHTSRKSAPSPDEVRNRVFNRVKEARMSTQPGAPAEGGAQQPEGQTPDGTQPDGSTPDGTGADGTPQTGTDDENPQGRPEGEPGQSSTVPESPTGGNVNPGASAQGKFTFQMNGAQTSDFSAVQAYINSLEASQREVKEGNRKDFVKSLVTDNKITAVQATATEEFALELSDKQYEKWVASWDAAPVQSLLGDHASDTAHGTGPTPQAKAENDEIEVAKAIVKQHKISNMALDKIKATASYQKVIAADPEFDLSKL